MTRGVAFKFVFWFRVCSWTLSGEGSRWFLYLLARPFYRHYMFKFGISIPYTARIGPGLYIGHFGGIVVSADAIIGANCNLSQNVTIGASNRGRRAGAPTIGDNVYIGPGAVVFGAITVGSHAAIGANAVVLDDVPEFGVVVGNPARLVSTEGSAGYVNHIDYPKP